MVELEVHSTSSWTCRTQLVPPLTSRLQQASNAAHGLDVGVVCPGMRASTESGSLFHDRTQVRAGEVARAQLLQFGGFGQMRCEMAGSVNVGDDMPSTLV